MQVTEFRTGVIHPIECAKEGFEIIKPNFWMLFGISIVGALIGGVSFYVLIGAMICGIFYAYLKQIDGGTAVFDDLWIGFKYFWPSLPVTLAVVVPVVAMIVVTFVTIYLPLITLAITNGKASESAVLGTFFGGLAIDLVFAVLMTCLHTLIIFAFPLIVDRGMGSWAAMKLSARAVLKNLGGITGLVGVNIGLAILGYCALGIGLYFAIPIITAANVVAYRKVFPRLDPQAEPAVAIAA